MPSYLEQNASRFAGFYAPSFSIKIDPHIDNEIQKAVTSLTVDDVLDGRSMFSINLFDELDRSLKRFKWLDREELDPSAGRKISISIGYAGMSKKSDIPFFTGVITALNPNFPSSGVPYLTIEGYDDSYRLEDGGEDEAERTFKNMKDFSDIIKTIAIRNGLSIGKLDSTGVTPKESFVIDAEDTNYSFIRSLASSFEYDFFVRNEKIYFVDPMRSKEKPISLTWGSDIISFSPRMSVAEVVTKVTVTGYSQNRDSKPTEGVATSKDLGPGEPGSKSAADMVKAGESSKEKTINRRFPVRSEQEAKAKAKAILIKANQSFIEGNCEIIGIPDLRAGSKVNIEGVGKRFEGVYYIKSAKHSISEGGYTTSLSLRRGRAGIV